MKQPTTPYISVVIPAFNEADYLPRTLGSLAKQSYRNFEVIVVDNGSNDNTAQIARHLGARIITQPDPGVCAARDAGTRAARGQIIVSTDADTVFDCDWLARIASGFKQPQVALVAGPPSFINPPLWGRLYSRGLFGLVGIIHKLSGQLVYASAANLAFRQDLWHSYNPKLTQGGDELYVLKQLRGRGQFCWLADNPVYTSSRRLKKGLLYNLIVTFIGYYASDYVLSKFAKRSLFGSYPAVRDIKSQRAWGWKVTSFAIVLVGLIYSLEAHPGMARAMAKHVPHRLHKLTIDVDRPKI